MGLTKSRLISRAAPMKGVKAIGFAPFLASDPVMNTVTGVVDLPVTIAPLVPTGTIARVEVKATGNNIVDTGTFDEATRTNEYVAVNTFFKKKFNRILKVSNVFYFFTISSFPEQNFFIFNFFKKDIF